jgi:hypothetical protein
LTAIAAFSFAAWRFSEENEAYVLPLFFSLLASLFYIKTIQRGFSARLALLSGFWAAMACLYHQIHIFWWLGLLVGGFWFFKEKRFSWLILYGLPFIMVPAAYLGIIYFYYGQSLTVFNISHFVLHDVYSGAVGGKPGIKHLLLGGINLVRSFVQVHGDIGLLLKNQPVYWLVFAALPLMAYGLFLLFRKRLHRMSSLRNIFHVHLLIFILQWLFAFYNEGNAEFMVMLPALAVILLGCYENISSKALYYIAAGLCLWNFIFGAWMANHYYFAADEQMAEKIKKTPGIRMAASEAALLDNILDYKYGAQPDNVLPSPSKYIEKYGSAAPLQKSIDSLLNLHIPVWTDCPGRPAPLSRAVLLHHEKDVSFFRQYQLQPLDSFPTAGGWHKLYLITSGP